MSEDRPDPTAAPFEETEPEAFMRRIAEVARIRSIAKKAVERTSAALAEAKADHNQAKQQLAKIRVEAEEIEEGETKDYPLFPRLKPPAPGNGPETPGDATHAPDVESPAPSPFDPSTVNLALLPGMPLSAALALGRQGIHTVGDLAGFTNGGGKLSGIKGLTELIAEKVLGALADFWASRGGKGAP